MSSKVTKEKSMVIQKEMISSLFKELSTAKQTGKKVVYTFVPGNISELIRAFDMLPVYPEINALQSGMRKKSEKFIHDAEKIGYSEDVCTYVKCDIGMMLNGNIGPTGCFTFMKWFENLKRLYPDVPVALLHTPYQEGHKITPEMTQYMVKQLKEEVIPKMEQVSGKKYDEEKLKVSGKKYDEEKLKKILRNTNKVEELMVKIFDTTKNKPSPIDAYFAGVYYIGPINIGFRGTGEAIVYYEKLYEEILERVDKGLGPITPEGVMEEEKFRLVIEGPPNWTHFREFWKLFYDLGAVIVASSYTKVGGVYDNGFRVNPDKPLDSLADYCMNCYTNLNLKQRVELLSNCITKYQADGFLVNSIKSCNSFSAGQLMIMRQLEEKLDIPVGFIESDLVDPRYFSYSNIKNRLESFFQMLEQRKIIFNN